jgi:hypothetical protein
VDVICLLLARLEDEVAAYLAVFGLVFANDRLGDLHLPALLLDKHALADFALASILISGVVTTVLVAGVYWIDRRHASDEIVAEPELTGPR